MMTVTRSMRRSSAMEARHGATGSPAVFARATGRTISPARAGSSVEAAKPMAVAELSCRAEGRPARWRRRASRRARQRWRGRRRRNPASSGRGREESQRVRARSRRGESCPKPPRVDGSPRVRYARDVRVVPVYFDPVVLRHDPGPYHPETAHRLQVVVETFRQDGRRIEAPPAPERTLKAVERVHDPAYVQRLAALCRQAPADFEGPFALFDCPDNPISAGTFEASLRAVSLTLAATDTVVAGRAASVF